MVNVQYWLNSVFLYNPLDCPKYIEFKWSFCYKGSVHLFWGGVLKRNVALNVAQSNLRLSFNHSFSISWVA